MEFLVINLRQSTDRLANIKQCFISHEISFKVIEAIDASDPSEYSTLNKLSMKASGSYFTKLKFSEIATFLSHRKAWQFVVDRNLQSCVIIEDDTQWIENPMPFIIELEKLILNDRPALIKLFLNRRPKTLSMQCLVKTLKNRSLLKPVVAPLGMAAYMLNRAGAEKLLQNTSTISEPVDVAIQRWWMTKVTIFLLQPPLAVEVSNLLGGSTIHAKSKNIVNAAKKGVLRSIFRFQIAMESYFYNFFGGIIHD
jgi:GR25 family glycosyltransferase involved in LPS biosynthesis